jgi:hypothetical protein
MECFQVHVIKVEVKVFAERRIDGILRLLGGAVKHASPFPPRHRARLVGHSLPDSGREQGMPGTSRTRSLACKMKKAQSTSLVWRHQYVHRIPRPTLVTIAKRPFYRTRDAAKCH